MGTQTANTSQSSDYFDNDPDFLQALNEISLPGPSQETPNITHYHTPEQLSRHNDAADGSTVGPLPNVSGATRKRARSPALADEEEGRDLHQVLRSVGGTDDPRAAYMEDHTYGAAHFGDFGEYMSRKRAKLQIQNADIDDDGNPTPHSRIFQGLQIYINGWTEPSIQDLRKMILQHGGIFHAYLDKKSLVTHIITCSLTPAKIKEFKYMKVVRPEWLTESIKAGELLPWRDFIFRIDERVEESQGRRTAQKSLSSTVPAVTQPTHSRTAKHEPIRPSTSASREPNDEPIANPSHPSTPPHSPRKSAQNTPSKPSHTTDPTPPEHAWGYASHKSNPHAERAMADPAWRAAHTSAAPDFIEGYYRNSRLHHLSSWKAELKNLVAEAQEQAESGGAGLLGRVPEHGAQGATGSQTVVARIVQENLTGMGVGGGGMVGDVSMKGARLVKKADAGKGKGKERAADEERVIMHCDFDSFFVSAGLVERPYLRGKPVVVCHSQGKTGGAASTSEIASASYEARKFGIKGGMSLQQARKLCPDLLTMPYEFELYKRFSLQFYTILMTHADDLQAVSVDEALIDVTSSIARVRSELAEQQGGMVASEDPAKDFADAIRAQVRTATGCEVSIGIAHNIMLARLASRRAKPAGSFHLLAQDAEAFLAPLDIDDLHGFGRSAHQKASEKLGATNLGELGKKSKAVLCDALGKGTGETLYKAIRGIDEKVLESDKPRKSVSCDINYGIRFENNAQAETFIYQMAEEVSRRLNSIEMRGKSLTLKIMRRDPNAPVEAPKFMGHGICETFNKQTPLIAPGGKATSNSKVIGEHAWRLLKAFSFDPRELRGIAIQIQKLEKGSGSNDSRLGQAVLPFKRTDPPVSRQGKASNGSKPPSRASKQPSIAVQPPSQEDDVQIIENPANNAPSNVTFDLPSFSQVDMSVFEALPEDVRKELEQEYQRRSATPAPGPSKEPTPAPASPKKYDFSGARKGVNVKRITRQLAPRSRPAIPMSQSKFFGKRVYASSIAVTNAELKRYGIDPSVFAVLPPELQREQLAAHRKPGAKVYFGVRKVLKPPKIRRGPGPRFRPPPPPQAVYPTRPTLKRQGRTKAEKLHFTEADDIQGVIEAWVGAFREHAPNARDVDYFAKFLVQSVEGTLASDTGVERAVAIAKWWLVLLRRYFGVWEDAPAHEVPEAVVEGGRIRVTSEMVGKAWWRAFREVKQKMDVAARQRFGGCLSLR